MTPFQFFGGSSPVLGSPGPPLTQRKSSAPRSGHIVHTATFRRSNLAMEVAMLVGEDEPSIALVHTPRQAQRNSRPKMGLANLYVLPLLMSANNYASRQNGYRKVDGVASSMTEARSSTSGNHTHRSQSSQHRFRRQRWGTTSTLFRTPTPADIHHLQLALEHQRHLCSAIEIEREETNWDQTDGRLYQP